MISNGQFPNEALRTAWMKSSDAERQAFFDAGVEPQKIMEKKSKRRQTPKETSAAIKAQEQCLRAESVPSGRPRFIPNPFPGEGPGRGRSYDDENEDTPWKHFCANCYSGVVSYEEKEDDEEYDDDDDFEFDETYDGMITLIRTPKYNCEGCKAVWYCDEECQSEHWLCHKHVCKASTGTKEERKMKKKKAKRWERKHVAMLDKERERLKFQGDAIMVGQSKLLMDEQGETFGRRFRQAEDSDDDDEE